MEISPVEMIRILPDVEFFIAKTFITLGERLNCNSKVRYATAHKSWKCVFSRTKPARVLYTVECTGEKWHIKACLWNIDAYRDLLGICSDKIKGMIIRAYDCRQCVGHCKGTAFTFEGSLYRKCVGCCFYFSGLCKEDWDSLLMLIEKEYEVTSKKR